MGTSLPSYSLCPDEITPGFSWSGAPANTKAFALTMHAPIRTEEEVAASIAAGEFQRDFKYWWILYNIPGSASSVEVGGTAGGKLGSNIAKGEPGPGYSPPCPRGEGTGIPIAFTMYALSEELEFAASTTVTWEALQEAMEGKVLESLTLDATFDSMAKSETE